MSMLRLFETAKNEKDADDSLYDSSRLVEEQREKSFSKQLSAGTTTKGAVAWNELGDLENGAAF